MKTKTFNEAVEVISAGDSAAKMLWSTQDWRENIAKLADTKNHRPVKFSEKDIDRNWVYHPNTGEWVKRDFTNRIKGAPKDTIYTKKTPVTLMPTDGVIRLFEANQPTSESNLALVIDINFCHLKNEKYIFAQDAVSHTKWWKKRKEIDFDAHQVRRGLSLIELKDLLVLQRQQGIIPAHNELLIGLSKEALVGLMLTKNERSDRLNAIAIKLLIKKWLEIDLPILIQSRTGIPAEYTVHEQMIDVDFVDALIGDKSFPAIDEEYKDFLRGGVIELPDDEIYQLSAQVKEEAFEKVEKEQLKSVAIGFFKKTDVAVDSYDRVANFRILINQLQKILRLISRKFAEVTFEPTQFNFTSYQSIIDINRVNILSFITNKFSLDKRLPLIKVLVRHLACGSPSILKEALFRLLEKNNLEFMPVIELLMKRCRGIKFDEHQKAIGHKFVSSFFNSSDLIEVYCTVNCWSILVSGIMNYPTAEMAGFMTNYFSENIDRLLTSLAKIEAIAIPSYSDGRCYIDFKNIRQARLNLLLKVKKDMNRKGLREERVILQNYFTQKINLAKNKTELDQAEKEYRECYLLGQDPSPISNGIYATLFGKPKPNERLEILKQSVTVKRQQI